MIHKPEVIDLNRVELMRMVFDRGSFKTTTIFGGVKRLRAEGKNVVVVTANGIDPTVIDLKATVRREPKGLIG